MAEFRKKIDSDWKKKAAQEKAALMRKKSEKESEGEDPGPRVTIRELFVSLATQAQIALGYVPDPMTRQRRPDPNAARFSIGMLEVLREKTEGNLSPEEDQMLQSLLSDLKMAYMSMMG